MKRIKRFNESINQNINFEDCKEFMRWLIETDEFHYINDKDDFIDDDRNRYTWEDMWDIYFILLICDTFLLSAFKTFQCSLINSKFVLSISNLFEPSNQFINSFFSFLSQSNYSHHLKFHKYRVLYFGSNLQLLV
jgi:hypothetical protein